MKICYVHETEKPYLDNVCVLYHIVNRIIHTLNRCTVLGGPSDELSGSVPDEWGWTFVAERAFEVVQIEGPEHQPAQLWGDIDS